MKSTKLNLNKETLRALTGEDEAAIAGGLSIRCGDSINICASDFPICKTHLASNCHPCY